MQLLLEVKDGVLGVLAVDLHQKLTGGNGEVVDQIGGDDRAGRDAQVARAVVVQLAGLIGIDCLAVHDCRGGCLHVLCEHARVRDHDIRAEQLGSLARHALDHIYLFHRALDRRHQRGDGDLHGLTGIDLVLVGIAEILREPHPRIVHERRDLLRADLVADRELHGLHELAVVGGRQRQRRDVLIGGIELFLIALDVRLCIAHGFLRGGRVVGKEQIARRDLLALADEHIRHRTGGSQRDRFAVLRLDHAAALHRRGDRAVLHNVGHDLLLAAAALPCELEVCQTERQYQHERDNAPYGLFAFLLILRRRGSARRTGRCRRHRLRGGFHCLFHVADLPFSVLPCVIHFIHYSTGFLRSLCEMVTIWIQNVTIYLCCI